MFRKENKMKKRTKSQRQRRNKIDELVNIAMNRRTWPERTKDDLFLLPYTSVYRMVANEWVDSSTLVWETYPRMTIKPPSDNQYLATCAAEVAKWEAIADKNNWGWYEMLALIEKEK
jgi:hypothetical protein